MGSQIIDLQPLRFIEATRDIEVHFKYIKNNYKFQSIKERSKIGYKKMFICEQIITLIAKIIENYYTKKKPFNKSKNNISY